MDSMVAEIRNKIECTPVVVYSKSYCPYCTKAKQALNSVGAIYECIELDQISRGNQIQNALTQITRIRTVPQVFVGGQCIGGGDDTARLQRSGELLRMVTAAGNTSEKCTSLL